MGHNGKVDYDVFLCHASEDKPTAVIPLAQELQRRGLSVWLDEIIMQIGDSITGKIDEGLANSRFGVVIVSSAFLGKNWPKRELDALAARETRANEVVVLPVLHGITPDEVASYSPTLASKFAADTSRGIEAVAEQIERRCKHPTVLSSNPKQPTNVVHGIPTLVRECLLEPPQPNSLHVIHHGETWTKYREMHILEQGEDLIAIWNYERGLHVAPPDNFAFTSRGVRIFQCNMNTGYSKHRFFIPYQDFRKYKFDSGLSLSFRSSGYHIWIKGPQEWHTVVAALWKTHAQLIVNDLNHLRDVIPGE